VENPKETDFFKITLAVMVGSVIAYFLIEAVERWRISQALQEMNRQSVAMMKNAQEEMSWRMAEERRLKMAAILEEQARKAEQDRANAERLRIEVQRKKEAIAAEEAKELAWKKFYTKPAHCDVAVGSTLVECGNQYIRAKREFEQKYAKGSL
jgi:E3 ubiquitin-protein ligase DOA10